MPNLPWPEMDSRETPGRTIRWLLDYLIWVSRQMQQLGYHSGSDRDEWCRRVQRAYAALFIPMYPGHGDPYPPDVPPSRNPGIWPDVPSSMIAGMTVRHQLTVTEMVGIQLRSLSWEHARPTEIADWDSRLTLACAALDHGESMPLPEEATTEPCRDSINRAATARKTLQEKARKRAQEIKKHLSEKRAAKSAAKNKRAAATPVEGATEPEQTPVGESGAKKVASKKAATKKKAAKKKAPAKKKAAAAKPAAKTPASKKKAAKKKATVKKKAAAAKPAAKTPTARSPSRRRPLPRRSPPPRRRRRRPRSEDGGQPAYIDMLAALRREFWGARISRHPTLRPHRTIIIRLIESLTEAA